MKHELSNRRPSALSAIFRRHQPGRLADWTRIVDGDWKCYCPHCSALVILIEEKLDSSAERGWSATHRSATKHEDRPWAWLVICREDGTFEVTRARATTERHESFGPVLFDEDSLIAAVEAAFATHYDEAGHPAQLVPRLLRAVA